MNCCHVHFCSHLPTFVTCERPYWHRSSGGTLHPASQPHSITGIFVSLYQSLFCPAAAACSWGDQPCWTRDRFMCEIVLWRRPVGNFSNFWWRTVCDGCWGEVYISKQVAIIRENPGAFKPRNNIFGCHCRILCLFDKFRNIVYCDGFARVTSQPCICGHVVRRFEWTIHTSI